jgi:hypothetical protein
MKLSLSQPLSEVLNAEGYNPTAIAIGEALAAALSLPKHGSLYDTASGLKSPAGLARAVVAALQRGLDANEEPPQ